MSHAQGGPISHERGGPTNHEPTDSPTTWVARHVNSYVESGGTRGHLFHGAPTLLLTTTGRRSGLPRRTALIYGRDGDRYLVVASNGGAADHPLWFHNLLAQPRVRVQVGADVFEAVAHPAAADERPRLWETMTAIWPHYTGYQRKAPREIPVVVIEQAAIPGSRGLRTDAAQASGAPRGVG